MKKISLILILFFSLSFNSFAFDNPEISLRCNEREGSVRLILESNDKKLLERAEVVSSYTLIKIDFSNDFIFKELSRPDSVSLSRKGLSLFFSIANLDRIKLIRLTSPSRLVVDAYLKGYRKPVIKKSGRRSFSSVMLDAGHGGHDRGIVNNNLKESVIAFSLVSNLSSAIKRKKGKTVYLSRESDKFMSIEDRIYAAIEKRASLFLSFHISNSHYFSVYTYKSSPYLKINSPEINYSVKYSQIKHIGNSKFLARVVGGALKSAFNIDVLYREMPLPLLSSVNSPALIVELPGSDFLNYDKSTYKLIAKAILIGLNGYEKR